MAIDQGDDEAEDTVGNFNRRQRDASPKHYIQAMIDNHLARSNAMPTDTVPAASHNGTAQVQEPPPVPKLSKTAIARRLRAGKPKQKRRAKRTARKAKPAPPVVAYTAEEIQAVALLVRQYGAERVQRVAAALEALGA